MKRYIQNQVREVIDGMIDTSGWFNRTDIVDYFGVSMATASKYISEYMKANPGKIAYNVHMKRYIGTWPSPASGDKIPMEYVLPLSKWLVAKHAQVMTSKGRDPTKYTSKYSIAIDAINACVNEAADDHN